MIVDLFAGAGGWAAGLATLGHDPADSIAVEWDTHAHATHVAAGWPAMLADVTLLRPADVAPAGADVLIASPPCQSFSNAGDRRGVNIRDELLARVDDCRSGWVEPRPILEPDDVCVREASLFTPAPRVADVGSLATLQPLRWTHDLTPRVLVCEQVPAVLPLWKQMASVLQGWGYSTATGILESHRYGVAQTRSRAVLVARRDVVRASLPDPTHTTATSMGDALGTLAPPPHARMLTAGLGNTAGQRARSLDEPSATILGRGSASWVDTDDRTSLGRVTTEQSAALQSFPHNWPWRGGSSAVYQQIGNAVPPLLAAAILGPLLSAPKRQAAA